MQSDRLHTGHLHKINTGRADLETLLPTSGAGLLKINRVGTYLEALPPTDSRPVAQDQQRNVILSNQRRADGR
jgi:hypothetical protein